jgi:hypothetical protein
VLLGGEVWVGCETPEPVGRETERAARVGDGATWMPSYGQMVRSWGGGGGGAVELWPKGSTCCRVACAGDEVRLACRVSACQAAACLAGLEERPVRSAFGRVQCCRCCAVHVRCTRVPARKFPTFLVEGRKNVWPRRDLQLYSCTVLLGCSDSSFWQSIVFWSGVAVLDPKFAQESESGLRSRQSPAGKDENCTQSPVS